MDDNVLKEWKRTKQELIDCIDDAIDQNMDVDNKTLKLMKELLIYSKIRCNVDRTSIDNNGRNNDTT